MRIQANLSLQNLRHNLQVSRRLAPTSKVLAVVKANAYGHGAVRLLPGLDDADAFAVTCIDEALELRAAGVTRPIVLLEGLLSAAELALCEQYQLQMVIHHPAQLAWFLQSASPQPLTVWLKVDTGMHRLGFPPTQVPQVYQQLANSAKTQQLHLISHFACADEMDHPQTTAQWQCWQQTVAGLRAEQSLCNSAALLTLPQAHLDWVRPGLMLYGMAPVIGRSAAADDLRPVLTLQSELMSIQMLRAGQAVGYAASFICPEAMPIGIVSCGYADGYPREIASGTPVLIRGQRAAIVGRISMDMLAIDLRGIPYPQLGDSVTLWGEGLPVEEIAAHANTIPYTLTCGITRRVPFTITE